MKIDTLLTSESSYNMVPKVFFFRLDHFKKDYNLTSVETGERVI